MLVRSGAVDLVAVDSVAALTPRAELEGQMGDQTVGLQARMMSQAMRKLAGNLNRTQTICLFTNQIREKVGVMFGSPETQPGGRALKFYSSQRLDIRRIETLKEGTEAVGNRVRVKVVKNKVAPPFRQAEFDIEFGQGISTAGCLVDLGIEHNVVTKSGSFFSYGDERLGQGRNNAKAFLNEHAEVAKEIEDKIYAALGPRPRPRRSRSSDDDDGDLAVRRRGRRAGRGLSPRPRRWPEGEPPGGALTPRRGSQHALDLAYRYLGRRDRTVAEVRRHLEAKRVEPRRRSRRRSPSCERAGLPRRRRLRAALRRGPPQARRVGRRADRAAPARARRGRRARRGGARRPRAATTSSRPRVDGAAPPVPRRAPGRRASASARSACSCARGYDLDLAYEAVRRFEREG